METSQRGRSRKRKVSTAKNFRNMIKRSLAFIMCLGIVLTNLNVTAVFADEIRTEITPDDDETYYTEEDNETYYDGYDNGQNDADESSPEEDSREDLTEGDEEAEENPPEEPDEETGNEFDDEETENEGREEEEETYDEETEEEKTEEEETQEEETQEEKTEIAEADGAETKKEETYSYKTVSAEIYTDETYEETFSDKVTIELSGRMPKGASVKAYPVEVEIENITVLAAYDITVFDGDGEVYEPVEDDAIEVTIENEEIREALKEESELTVFHIDEESDEPEEIVRLPRKTKKAKFFARHFSIYIVGTDDGLLYDLNGETRHCIYMLNFYIGDVTDTDGNYILISAQTVSPGEKVEMPTVPDYEDYEFDGWYSKPGGEGKKYEFYDGVMPEIREDDGGTSDEDEDGAEDVIIDLYAHFVQAHTVHYMTHEHEAGDEDTKVIFHSEHYTDDMTLDTGTAEKLYLAEGYLSYIDETTGALITALAVTGWLDADGSEWKTGDKIDWSRTDGVLELYPVVEPAYWIYYNMNGHDGIKNPVPEYVLASETAIGTLPEPEVSGYSFDGWHTKSEGGERVMLDTALADIPKNTDGSITLYAHWSEAGVAYTINIWRQKAIDGKAGTDSKVIKSGETYDDYIRYYDYAESHYVTAEQSKLKTGDTPSENTVYNWNTYTGYATTSKSGSAYYGFEYGKNTEAETRTLNNLNTIRMAADGSTIINIFYNRVTVTWKFSRSYNYGVNGTLIGLYDTNVYQGDDPAGTLSDWPAPGANRRWRIGTDGTYMTFKARFDLENDKTEVSFTNVSQSTNRHLYYYLEVTNADTQIDVNGAKAKEAYDNGVAYTKTVNDTLYVYCQTASINSSNSFNFSDKFSGYFLAGYIDDRNGADQSSYTPASAGGNHSFSNDGYIFNNANNKLTITLISGDRIVGVDAAGYAAPTAQQVTYPDKNRTSVKYAADMSNYPFPGTLDGDVWGPAYYYRFAGWYADPTLSTPFTTATVPNYNLVAYADWELNDITVTFATGTPDVAAPEIQELKATQKAADPGILEREGYTHVGWVDKNGKVFNFDTVLYEDTALTAIWKADDESGYTMRYDLNIENSNGLLDGYPGETAAYNRDHFTVDEELWTIGHAFPDLAKDETYGDAPDMFIGWNTAADGSGRLYYPDDIFTLEDVEVSNEGTVTLYAVWAHRNESTLVLYYNYPEGYISGETGKELTGDNLTHISLEEESGLEYHHEITVSDTDGTIRTYRFDGWSSSDPGDDPTDDAVDIKADAVVAVDTLYTYEGTKANYLYAVWLEVHDITVTKEVVGDALNYEIPEDLTFAFRWTFTDGEGNENACEDPVRIRDGEYFIIPAVASGESVTITEIPSEGFTASYNGAHTDAEDNGEGRYIFTMDDNSREITVTNTVMTYETVDPETPDEGGESPESEDDPGEETGPAPEETDEDTGDDGPESGAGGGSSSGNGGSGSGSGSRGGSVTISHVRNVNNGKTGHWILEGGYLTLPDGSHPSNEYLDVDGEIWAFYTYGYAVARKHTQYYTSAAIAAAGYIPETTGTWETIGWWFEYDDGTYPHNEWAQLEYNGLTYWYHFDEDGWMDDGWFTENGNTYYLDPVFDGWRGHMMTGWQKIGGYWYYFSEDKNRLGVLLKDTETPDGFKVDENGRWDGR